MVSNLIRNIALFIRQHSEQKESKALLQQFDEWRILLSALPAPQIKEPKLALVRLDDIGDYLLWRNCMPSFKMAAAYQQHKIYLIGNVVWKSIFEAFDQEWIDETIWVDKQQYFADADYRADIWTQIRSQEFSDLICPSRTRPLLLDDIICLASAATKTVASTNCLRPASLNEVSDACYTKVYPKGPDCHEFFYNKRFTEWLTGQKIAANKPSLVIACTGPIIDNQIICFIGASAGSKKWPLAHWISLIKRLQTLGFKPLLSGGKNESSIAEKIVAATGTDSIVGNTTLVESLEYMAHARAIITGDSMAAHAGVSLAKPTIILANGVNATRFVAYEQAGIQQVKTIYAEPFLNSKTKTTDYRAVSSDMQSIKPESVILALQQLLG